jgi:2-methylcitrate dehydratase PrpD
LALADFDGDALNDPEVLKLSAKIRREDDPNSGRPMRLGHVLTTKDGKVYEERQHIHPGHVETRCLLKMFKKNIVITRRLVNEEAESLLRQVMAIDQLASMRATSNFVSKVTSFP